MSDDCGQRELSRIYTSLNQYHVVMEVDPQYAKSPEALKDIYVPANGGASPRSTARPSRAPTTGAAVSAAASSMVPLSTIAHFADSGAPTQINHQDTSVATNISLHFAD